MSSNKKKIAIVTPVFPPYRGGIGTVAYHYARLLASRGQDVTVFAPDYGHGDPVDVPGAHVVLLKPRLAYGNAAWIPDLALTLRSFDTVILQYPFFGGMRQVLLGKQKGYYRLVMVYNMDVVSGGLKGLIFKYTTAFFLPKIVKACDVVLVSSGDYAKHSNLAPFWKENGGRCDVIPLGVDVDRFSPGAPPPALYERFSIPQNKKIVLFAGGLDPAHYFKGVPHLIRAARGFDKENVHLVIAGKGSLVADYEALALENGVRDMITFTGGVSDDDLVSLYRAAAVTVLPSIDRSESFGIVLVESMACGTPVVASDLPGVRSVYEDGVSGVRVAVGEEDKLAEAIHRIVYNDGLRQQMSGAARERAVRYFDWEKIGDALLTKV